MKCLQVDELAELRPTYSATSAVNTPLFLTGFRAQVHKACLPYLFWYEAW